MALTDRLVPAEAQNVGGLDRKLRAVAGTVFVLAAVGLFVWERPTLGAFAGLTGGGLLFNAVTGFCGVNALLGVDTCSRKS